MNESLTFSYCPCQSKSHLSVKWCSWFLATFILSTKIQFAYILRRFLGLFNHKLFLIQFRATLQEISHIHLHNRHAVVLLPYLYNFKIELLKLFFASRQSNSEINPTHSPTIDLFMKIVQLFKYYTCFYYRIRGFVILWGLDYTVTSETV